MSISGTSASKIALSITNPINNTTLNMFSIYTLKQNTPRIISIGTFIN